MNNEFAAFHALLIYLIILLLVFHKFLETNGPFMLKIIPAACGSFVCPS
jgi:hypothetical protein